MQILCVEDGSVDLDALEKDGLKDGKVLVYRQGSTPPFILELEMQSKIDYELMPYRIEAYKRLYEKYKERYRELKIFVLDTISKYKDNILYKGKAFDEILDFIREQGE